MSNRLRFADLTVLVTGAAGGIGRATSLAFLTEGANVVAADLDAHAVNELAGKEREPGTLFSLPGDVTDQKYCKDLIETVFARTGRLDVLVNNAGLMRRGNILATSDEDWSRCLEVNVTAVFRLCREAIPRMVAMGGRRHCQRGLDVGHLSGAGASCLLHQQGSGRSDDTLPRS